MHIRTILLLLAINFLCLAEALAGDSHLAQIQSGVERFTLSNGMRVVFYRRPRAPVFSGQVWVRVGGVDEVVGQTGIAHLLEHMAFKGTDVIGTKDYAKEKPLLEQVEELAVSADSNVALLTDPRYEALTKQLSELWKNNDFSVRYEKRGAVGLNAGTAKDYTVYLVSLPSASFELWCWLESDRLINPVFRQFYKEREVVLEERRMRVDDNPSGKLFENLFATAFQVHPNRLPLAGYTADLHRVTAGQTKAFYERYYRPDNMVLVLVGDLERASIEPMLERYFSRIPPHDGPRPSVTAIEPPQEGERQSVVRYDATPRLAMAFHKPVYPNPDDAALSVIHHILADGRSSRLIKDLVIEKRLASSVYTSEGPGELYPNVYIVGGTPARGVSNVRLARELQAHLNRLKEELVTPEELASALRRLEADLLSSLGSNYGLARTLGHAELLWGSWESFFDFYERVAAVTPSDIRDAARKYFHVSNRSTVLLERPNSVTQMDSEG